MGPVVDIVGHFGTAFSYATVASNVARMLGPRLGQVSNLDDGWHPHFSDLRERSTYRDRGTHVVVMTAPNHYIDVYATQYGKERSAIYMSPNTDTLDKEHAETCGKFGLAITPSGWCEKVVREAVPDIDVALLPLGVEEEYARDVEKRVANLALSAHIDGRCEVWHFSTDQSWPGRKGTEELLKAWQIGQESGRLRTARLNVHLPPALGIQATRLVRDLRIEDTVTLHFGGLHGGAHDVRDIICGVEGARADLVVAPSRCEGFGMVLLASVVAGVPLLCTCATGQWDFLSVSHGWLGIPTPQWGPIAREAGTAPIVEPSVLAETLCVAVTPDARKVLLRSQWPTSSKAQRALEEEALRQEQTGRICNGKRAPSTIKYYIRDWGTWPWALRFWHEKIIDHWLEETK